MGESVDGTPSYNSFILDGAAADVDLGESDSEVLDRKASKAKDTKKLRMAQLIEKIVYHLEKLRYIMDGAILPRDANLRLFDSRDDNEQSVKRKFNLNDDR